MYSWFLFVFLSFFLYDEELGFTSFDVNQISPVQAFMHDCQQGWNWDFLKGVSGIRMRFKRSKLKNDQEENVMFLKDQMLNYYEKFTDAIIKLKIFKTCGVPSPTKLLPLNVS
jgi:hypothetical protein